MTQHNKIVEALIRLGIGGWTVRGEDIEWDEGVTPPSQAEIDAEIAYLEFPEYEKEKWRKTFSVPTYKLEIELEERGFMETIQGIIDQSPRAVQIAWQKAGVIRRMSPTVLAMAPHPKLKFTPEQLDDIFKSADKREL